MPRAVKHTVRHVVRVTRLRRALRDLSIPPAPSPAALERLRDAWGNTGMAARLEFLEAVAAHGTTTRGPVLECGSGLTTLLLAVLLASRRVDLWSLEHSAEWHAETGSMLRACQVPDVRLSLTSLRDYGDFTWYDPPLDRLPARFGLVVCDGPPGTTPGGRYGLLPVLRDRLAAGCVILVDDVDRAADWSVMELWAAERPLKLERHGCYATVTLMG